MSRHDIATSYLYGQFDLSDMGLDHKSTEDDPILVFIPQGLVEADEKFHHLTWREFQSLLPDVVDQDIRQRLEQEQLLGSDDLFDPSVLPGSPVTGMWPEWPGEGMYHWLPPSVLDRFGEDRWLNWGETILSFDPALADPIVSKLEEIGYSAKADHETVQRVCSQGWHMWEVRS